MSTVRDILAEAKRYELTISVDGDKIDLKAPAKPPQQFLDKLKANKPQLIAELSESNSSPVDVWFTGVERMTECDVPEGCQPDTWRSMIDACVFFLDAHGAAAAALGWDAISLFGAHPEPRFTFAYTQCHGLIIRHHNARVVALAETIIVFTPLDGGERFQATKSFMAGAVPVWELCQHRGAVWNT